MKLKYILLILLAILAFVSCSDEDTYVPTTGGASDAYLKIQMNLPEFNIPVTGGKATRAMTHAAEKALDPDMFTVLVFRYFDSGDGSHPVFWYKAPIIGGLVFDENDPTKAEATIKLVKSESDNDMYSITIIANHDISDAEIQQWYSKPGVYSDFIYDLPGKWNADDTNPELFPMCGESDPFNVTENMSNIKINMVRALARIDVGLGFTVENGKWSEKAEGIENFSLKEVKVYRTYDKIATAPTKDYRFEPTIPHTATRREDNNPLSYTLPNDIGGNALVREIYVPEADIASPVSNDNVHCLVIGGYYRGSTTMTYYRLDFSTLGDDFRTYYYLLRNHRYIFNITEVMGPGFSTAEEALKSHATINKIGYDLIVWDETIHEMEVQGKYYFGLDQRDILFEAPSSTEDTNNIFNIKYQTNYPLSATDPMTFTWKSEVENPLKESPFAAVWDPSTKGIKLTAKKANETNTVLSDSLFVKAGPFTLKVHVQQKYINFKYTVTCETVTVTGTYKRSGTLNANHYITLSVTAEDRNIEGYNYVLETDTVNGISFRAEGQFNFAGIATGQPLVQNIKLMGTGTIDSDIDNMPFTLQIRSNSSSGSYCEATITPVITKMRVLTIANNDNYGYDIGNPNRGANLVVSSPNNFGPNDNSIVKIDGFEFIRSGNNISSLSTTTKQWLRDGAEVVDEDGVRRKYLADILYIGHDGLHAFSNDADAQIFIDYMKKGGVIISFFEGETGIRTVMKALFNQTSITLSGVTGNGVLPFIGHDLYKTGTEEEWAQYLYSLQSDPILNGPFGNLIDKQWGEDAGFADAININAFPTTEDGKIIDDITIYSYNTNLGASRPSLSKDYVSSFKYETSLDSDNLVSFVFFCDGGFVSSDNSTVAKPHTGSIPCPLWWDTTTMFPIPKNVNGRGYNNSGYPAYNSQAFCNTLAWAINRSADLYRDREAAMGR